MKFWRLYDAIRSLDPEEQSIVLAVISEIEAHAKVEALKQVLMLAYEIGFDAKVKELADQVSDLLTEYEDYASDFLLFNDVFFKSVYDRIEKQKQEARGNGQTIVEKAPYHQEAG